MKESDAWLVQSTSDWATLTRVFSEKDCATYCQTIAKCQQTVEKAIKAVVAALREASIATFTIGWKHEVGQFVSALPRIGEKHDDDKDIMASIRVLFCDKDVISGVRLLDSVVPKRPPPGSPLQRNTEYPFHADERSYRAPAESGVFSLQDVRRARSVADQVYIGCCKITSALKRI